MLRALEREETTVTALTFLVCLSLIFQAFPFIKSRSTQTTMSKRKFETAVTAYSPTLNSITKRGKYPFTGTRIKTNSDGIKKITSKGDPWKRERERFGGQHGRSHPHLSQHLYTQVHHHPSIGQPSMATLHCLI